MVVHTRKGIPETIEAAVTERLTECCTPRLWGAVLTNLAVEPSDTKASGSSSVPRAWGSGATPCVVRAAEHKTPVEAPNAGGTAAMSPADRSSFWPI